jgi:hypothetical protein
MEATVKYHFAMVLPLMLDREPASRQGQARIPKGNP